MARAAEGHHEERPWKSTGADSGGVFWLFSLGNWGETSDFSERFFGVFSPETSATKLDEYLASKVVFSNMN